MNFALIDDDEAVRSMLQDIIEDYDLGEVPLSLPSATALTSELLRQHDINIIIIDLLMPGESGVDAVGRLAPGFGGKIVMLSQVESKDMVGSAYENGVDYYITKPLNRNEIVSVLKGVSEHLRLSAFAQNLQHSLAGLSPKTTTKENAPRSLRQEAEARLRELGISSAVGAGDMLDILDYLESSAAETKTGTLPPLKTIFTAVAEARGAAPARESKAMEQRLRRSIFQALVAVAGMGIVDCTNPKFEDAAPSYFDYADVRLIMKVLEQDERPQMSQVRINIKKFLQALWDASKKNTL